MDHRLLGRSGFKVSELTYGNWVTHGSQIEEDAAQACVHAALDCGITSFDTADVYARGRAEEILGRALKGQPRAGLDDLPGDPVGVDDHRAALGQQGRDGALPRSDPAGQPDVQHAGEPIRRPIPGRAWSRIGNTRPSRPARRTSHRSYHP